jgi:hypothetical protein
MMKVREMSRALGLGASLGLALFAACAGKDPPQLTADQADAIQAAYDGAASGSAGAGGGAGLGGGAGASSAAGAGGGGSQAGSSAGGGGGSAGAGVAGSGGGSTAAAGSSGSTGSVNTCDGFAVLAANCGTSGCHGEGSNLEDFADSEAAAREFIDAPGTLACGGQDVVIDTEDPAESLMVRKLSDDPPCGQQMPPGGGLTPADVDCIEDWIGGL